MNLDEIAPQNVQSCSLRIKWYGFDLHLTINSRALDMVLPSALVAWHVKMPAAFRVTLWRTKLWLEMITPDAISSGRRWPWKKSIKRNFLSCSKRKKVIHHKWARILPSFLAFRLNKVFEYSFVLYHKILYFVGRSHMILIWNLIQLVMFWNQIQIIITSEVSIYVYVRCLIVRS